MEQGVLYGDYSQKNDIDFGVATEFNSKYLTPIINNLLFKAENEWDDYNEVYHCCNWNGQIWFKDIIMPYYKSKKYKTIYVKSSHEKVFSMYNRLGSEIAEYTSNSDNHLFKRKGKVFRIPL